MSIEEMNEDLNKAEERLKIILQNTIKDLKVVITELDQIGNLRKTLNQNPGVK